jgi:hypothetical protein
VTLFTLIVLSAYIVITAAAFAFALSRQEKKRQLRPVRIRTHNPEDLRAGAAQQDQFRRR